MIRNLEQYIRKLIAENKLYTFYKSKDWLNLRQQILNKNHNECYECLKRGKYKRAVTVHHVKEVKIRPDLALSEYYIDENGDKQVNLKPLCKQCHNAEHSRFSPAEKRPQLNKERW